MTREAGATIVLRLMLGALVAAVSLTVAGAAQLPSGRIAGQVVTTDDRPQPVRRAIVTLTGTALATNISAITDDQGRFAFADLAPGRYTVTVSKPAFLTTAYGARRAGRPGTPVAIAGGGQRMDLVIPLPRGAVISGMVRDLLGAPAANIPVTISRAELADGVGGFAMPSEQLMTDDRGIYRAYGLEPGEYLVAATPEGRNATGVVVLSAEEREAILRRLRERGAGSALPRLAATMPPRPAAGDAPVNRAATGSGASVRPEFDYAPVFFPGTPVVADATRVRVEAGESRETVDFTMDLVRTARVSGTVTMADGSPLPPVRLSMSVVGPPLPYFLFPRLTTSPGQSGSFAYESVTPGRYLLFARAVPEAMAAGSTQPSTPGAVSSGGLLEANPAATLFAMTEVTVNGADVVGAALALRPSMSFSGRVTFETDGNQPPADLAGIRVGLGARLPDAAVAAIADPSGPAPLLPTPASTAPDGTFTVKGILPGRYLLSASGGGAAGWRLKSAVVGGRDILDAPIAFDVSGGDHSGAVLTFASRQSEIAGSLQSSAGEPASEYFVIVYPTDRTRWFAGSRRVQATRPGTDGRFAFANLPAGDYLIAALTDVEPGEWQRPAFLTQLVASSIPIALPDGGRVRQDFKIAR